MIATTRQGDEQFFFTLHSVIAIGGFSTKTKKDILDIFELFDFPVDKKGEKAINKYLKNRKRRVSNDSTPKIRK